MRGRMNPHECCRVIERLKTRPGAEGRGRFRVVCEGFRPQPGFVPEGAFDRDWLRQTFIRYRYRRRGRHDEGMMTSRSQRTL